MNITERKYYPLILVIFYSCLGITLPASVTQFSMVVSELSQVMNVNKQIILLADTFRATCLVFALFLSSYIYKKIGLKKAITLGLMFQILPQFFIPIVIKLQSIPFLFLLKGIQGFNAIAFPLYLYSIIIWMPSRFKGLATAVFNGSFVAGAGIGAWISGKIIPTLGWNISFYFIGVLCLIFAVPALILTRDRLDTINEHEQQVLDKKKSVYGAVVKNPITWLLITTLIANTWVSQAITVDMSVYAKEMGYNYNQIGNLMLIISIVTVIGSIMAGGVSDYFAGKSNSPLKTRSFILGMGYLVSAIAAVFLPFVAKINFNYVVIASALMMFGVSWAAGVFWALPSDIYKPEDNIAGTAFCSGASNIPNPIAPMVVGVVLGTNGFWTIGWLTCALVSIISFVASRLLRK